MLLPPLHGTADSSLLTAWTFNPPVVAGLLIAAVGYYLALQRARLNGRGEHPLWQVLCFYGGLVSVAIALLGPLDAFNDNLFFMHMLQHLALMQIAAPLLLLGRPVQLMLRAISPKRSGPVLKPVLRRNWVRWLLTALSAPLLISLLFNVNLAGWHFPLFYEAALRSDLVHEIEHAAFFGLSLLFWWPIIEPVPRHHKIRPMWAMLAIFVTMAFGIGIGAALTLAGHVIYPFYAAAEQPWGLTPMVDQQIGGLIMWVGSGTLYMIILLTMLVRLLGTGNEPADDSLDQSTEWSDRRPQPSRSS